MRSQQSLTVEQQQLVTQYLPLARSLAKPYRRRWPNHADEFESDAVYALIGAARRFDAARRVAFGHFARMRILGALKDKHKVIVTPGKDFSSGDVSQVAVTLRIESAVSERELLRAVMRFLPRLQRKVIRWVDQHGLTQAELRKWLDRKGKHRVRLSATTISVYRSKARAAMRRYGRLIEDADLLRRILGKLPPRQAMAFRHTCIDAHTLVHTAREMGISHVAVLKLRRKAMVRVDAELEACGAISEQGDAVQEGE